LRVGGLGDEDFLADFADWRRGFKILKVGGLGDEDFLADFADWRRGFKILKVGGLGDYQILRLKIEDFNSLVIKLCANRRTLLERGMHGVS